MTPDPITVLVDAVRVRELLRVLSALDAIGAVPLVFKGAALAHTHYEHSWQRPRLDADILIAPASRPRVFDALGELGYERPALISGDLVMYQAPFGRVDNLGIEHALDIHWRVANPQLVADVLTHDDLIARAVTISVLDQPMRVPSASDALLLACIHRAAHHADSEDEVWLNDIHLIATRLADAEWRLVVERACERKVRAICARGLALAANRFGTRVPPDVRVRLSEDRGQPERSAVYLRKDLRLVDRLVADLRAVGPKQAAHLIREHLFPPVNYMHDVYGVRHRALLPAYYAYRAVRGVSKWLRP